MGNEDKKRIMSNIVVNKINEVYLHIQCEESTAAELSDFFTFKVPTIPYGHRYRRWDGSLRLFNKRQGLLYVGVYPYLKEFARANGYTISGWQPIAREFSAIEAVNYIKSLNIHSNGQPLEARDYQIKSVVYGIRDSRMLLLSPTSSGKSFIQYVLFRYLTDVLGKKKGLLIVPTINLVEQMFSDFKDYSSHNSYSVNHNVHKIYQGMPMYAEGKSLYITTWQSMQNQPEEYFSQFDYVLGDEAHTFKAKSLKYIMECLLNADIRIGLTGTLDGSQCHKIVLEGLFGRVRSLVTTRQLMERKQIAELMIKILFLKYNENLSRNILNQNYTDEMDWILASTARNRFISNLALSLNGNTLILFQYVEKHGMILNELISKQLEGTGRNVYFIHGKVGPEIREYVRKIVETEKDAIIIASYGTFQLGVSINHIHNLIFAGPSKSRIRVLQSIGRGLRLGEFKHLCTLFDIVDDFSVGNATNTILDHFQDRYSYYQQEKFDHKFYTIHVKGE